MSIYNFKYIWSSSFKGNKKDGRWGKEDGGSVQV